MINYQGNLSDSDGNALTGSYSVEFFIYYTETGDLPVWSETHNITTGNGYFSTMLGSVSSLPIEVFDTDEVWLAIKIGSDSEMTPRKRISSVAYAFKAGFTDYLGDKTKDDFVEKESVNSVSEDMIVDNDVTLRKIAPNVLSSIDGVYNDGGDVDLIAGDNIHLTTNNTDKSITISATNSGGITSVSTDDINDNAVTLPKIAPTILTGIDGVENDGGQIDLIAGSNITITPDDNNNRITISAAGGEGGDNLGNHTATQNVKMSGNWLSNDGGDEGVYVKSDGKVGIGTNNPTENLQVNGTIKATKVNATQSDNFILKGEQNSITSSMITDNSVTSTDIQPSIVSTLDGVSNDGGNIDFVAGDNVTITPNDAQNKITIAASGGEADNLGNHTATSNLKTNGNWISNDGGNEGIYINPDGKVGVGKSNPTYHLEVDGYVKVENGNMVVENETMTNSLYVKNTQSEDLLPTFAGYFEHEGKSGWAIRGICTSSEGYTKGGDFSAEGKASVGIAAYANGSNSEGVYSDSYGENCRGVVGLARNPTSQTYGGYFYNKSNEGRGVYGYTESTSGYTFGGYFESESNDGRGVYGYASGSRGIGVFGSSEYLAGMFTGNVSIFGTLAKSAGSFRIDHPLEPESKFLQHSFVESPDMMNVYNGNIILDYNGEAIVELPDYFDALNRDFRYQLTAIGMPGPNLYIAEKISGNHFKIAGGAPDMEVSWMVTGIRDDAYARSNPIEVEVQKDDLEQGKYIFPEGFGHSSEMKIDYNEREIQIKQVERNKEEFKRLEVEESRRKEIESRELLNINNRGNR